MILCLCAMYRNPTIFNSIFDNNEKKLLILKSFIAFAINHKNESVKAKSRIIKDHLNCDFVNSDEENEDSALHTAVRCSLRHSNTFQKHLFQ